MSRILRRDKSALFVPDLPALVHFEFAFVHDTKATFSLHTRDGDPDVIDRWSAIVDLNATIDEKVRQLIMGSAKVTVMLQHAPEHSFDMMAVRVDSAAHQLYLAGLGAPPPPLLEAVRMVFITGAGFSRYVPVERLAQALEHISEIRRLVDEFEGSPLEGNLLEVLRDEVDDLGDLLERRVQAGRGVDLGKQVRVRDILLFLRRFHAAVEPIKDCAELAVALGLLLGKFSG